jgi:HPt (histidine-containing phosphotransfer) domain-containing protein
VLPKTKAEGSTMIDWGRVTELRDEVGVEDFSEVFELFLSEVEERLDEIDLTSDAQKMEEDMHFLKGSALNLGFQTFAELCQKAESSWAAGQAFSSDPSAIKALYDQSKNAFMDGIEKLDIPSQQVG